MRGHDGKQNGEREVYQGEQGMSSRLLTKGVESFGVFVGSAHVCGLYHFEVDERPPLRSIERSRYVRKAFARRGRMRTQRQ